MVRSRGTFARDRSHSFFTLDKSGIPLRCQFPCSMRTEAASMVTVGLKSLMLYVAVPETSELAAAPECNFRVPAPKASVTTAGWAEAAGRGALISSVMVGPVGCVNGRLIWRSQALKVKTRTKTAGKN